MQIFILLLLSILISCERHQLISKVTEVETFSGSELLTTEKLEKAFLELDYNFLKNQFEAGANVDTKVFSGKTLLFKAIQAQNYKMISFLLSYNANPSEKITINDDISTPREYLLTIEDQIVRNIISKMLENKFNEVSSFLFFDTIKNIKRNTPHDLEWLKKLLLEDFSFKDITLKEFKKHFIKSLPKATNYLEVINLIFSFTHKYEKNTWKEWVERPFIKGRFRKAKCTFIEEEMSFNFEEFLDTCNQRVRKKLIRAKSKIKIYIDIRNAMYQF